MQIRRRKASSTCSCCSTKPISPPCARPRAGKLTFTIDGGCCEGTAPHLFEDAVLPVGTVPVAEVAGIPVYLQPAMVGIYAEADVTIDVVEEPLSDAMSLETE